MTSLVLMIGVSLLLMITSSPCYAKVAGSCPTCHTMHNMQDSAPMGTSTVNPSLLVTSCIGCHSSDNSATWKDATTGAPIVYHYGAAPPATPLAGGDFYWVAQVGDAYGHNVGGISAADSRFTRAPGTGTGDENCFRTDKDGVNGACHGYIPSCRGCHVPRHHAPDKSEPAQYALVEAAGGYYRFLGQIADSLTGEGMHTATGFVKGGEDPNWEQNPSSAVHNEYAGEVAYAAPNTYRSIGQRGCGCHLEFTRFNVTETSGGHVESPTSDHWIRHPNDAPLGGAGTEYAGYTTYDPVAPICRPNVASYAGGPSSVVTPGTDLVMCLSCHRAHGSPYPKMMRWDYKSWPGGGTNGCAVCHSTKD